MVLMLIFIQKMTELQVNVKYVFHMCALRGWLSSPEVFMHMVVQDESETIKAWFHEWLQQKVVANMAQFCPVTQYVISMDFVQWHTVT